MHWLPKRLKQLDKTGAGLAKVLKVRKQSVYNIYMPEKGHKPRKLTQHEIEPTARYLEWSIEELMANMHGRKFDPAKHGTEVVENALLSDIVAPRQQHVIYRAAQAERGGREGYMLHTELAADIEPPLALGLGKKPLKFKVVNEKTEPVYRLRDTIVVDPEYEIILGEDCLFTSEDWSASGGFCVIARLVREEERLWICQVVGGEEQFELPKSDYPNAWAITERYRP